jgi:hypothetical protein
LEVSATQPAKYRLELCWYLFELEYRDISAAPKSDRHPHRLRQSAEGSGTVRHSGEARAGLLAALYLRVPFFTRLWRRLSLARFAWAT